MARCSAGTQAAIYVFCLLGTLALPIGGAYLNRIRGGLAHLPNPPDGGSVLTHDGLGRAVMAFGTALVLALASLDVRRGVVLFVVGGALSYFGYFIGWGAYFGMAHGPPDVHSRVGFADWLYGYVAEDTPHLDRFERDLVAMSLRGLLQTAPTGMLMLLLGYGYLPLLSGVMMGPIYVLGFAMPTVVKAGFAQGTPLGEAGWGFWILLTHLLTLLVHHARGVASCAPSGLRRRSAEPRTPLHTALFARAGRAPSGEEEEDEEEDEEDGAGDDDDARRRRNPLLGDSPRDSAHLPAALQPWGRTASSARRASLNNAMGIIASPAADDPPSSGAGGWLGQCCGFRSFLAVPAASAQGWGLVLLHVLLLLLEALFVVSCVSYGMVQQRDMRNRDQTLVGLAVCAGGLLALHCVWLLQRFVLARYRAPAAAPGRTGGSGLRSSLLVADAGGGGADGADADDGAATDPYLAEQPDPKTARGRMQRAWRRALLLRPSSRAMLSVHGVLYTLLVVACVVWLVGWVGVSARVIAIFPHVFGVWPGAGG